MQKFAASVFLLALVWGCHATYNQGVIYPFPLDSLLTCRVPNPFANQPYEPNTVAEEPPLIPIQPGRSGEVWEPQRSGFRVPNFGRLDKQELLAFLGSDLNTVFSAVTEPRIDPPLGLERLPVEIGSGGQPLLAVEDPDPPIPGIELFEDQDPDGSDAAAIRAWIAQEGLGDCEVMPAWTLLHESFFPRWYAGSFCSGNNCSFPRGLTCEPDIGPGRLVYITVLRWDCCWTFLGRSWQWECGWRKVQIPIIIDCDCACSARLRSPTDEANRRVP